MPPKADWEKYKPEKFADDETPEKKIVPLSEEYVAQNRVDCRMMADCR
jgi:hypothetical protein